MGFDRFKIAGRNKRTEWIVRAVKAYSERRYEGNLLDIVSYPQGRAVPKVMEKVNGPRDYEILREVYVDNTKFPPNWLNFFKYNDCEGRSCSECAYCPAVAREVIRVGNKEFASLELKKIQVPFDLITRFGGNG